MSAFEPQPTAPGEPPAVDLLIDAVFEDGVIRPLAPIDLPPGTRVVVRIAARSTPARTEDTPRPAAAMLTRADLAPLLLGLLVYALTRLIGLASFPIYFFCDEAIQSAMAQRLLQHGLRDQYGVLLPPYFQNSDLWNLSLSVYLHLAPVALFGTSVLATRATSALVSVLAALAVTLTLRLFFDNRFWWSGALVLGALPVWFLHSRTAFETVMMVSFYACFLCAYLLYRYRSPRYLPLALLCGAATFYSYANGQGVMLASGVLLLLSDLRYHLRVPMRLAVRSALLAALLATPYLRFRALHPEALGYQLHALSSYWLSDQPLAAKLATFGWTYLQGLSPAYWFLPNDVDLARHQMRGLGHLSPLALPFWLIGLGVCLRNWRSSAHRLVLIAMLAAPFSAALVAILAPRVLAMVVPATLLICIGIDQAGRWLSRRVPQRALAIGCAALLCLLTAGELRAALVDGPTWYSDYGLYGMQYGATQVFAAIPQELDRSSDTRIVLSPNWANNPNVFLDFFLTAPQIQRVELASIDSYLIKRRELDPRQLFILPPEEYARARADGKLAVGAPERIIPYPDGRPGFYFVRLRYSAQADALFAAERAARQQLQEAEAELDGAPVRVRHSRADIGQAKDLFDGNPDTVLRGMEANPLVIELSFASPRPVGRLKLQTARMNLGLKITLTPADGGPTVSFAATYRDLPGEPKIDYAFPGGPRELSALRIEITDLDPGEDVHIHVRELALQ
jgi:predicted DNA-binding antitoxin AbrB/MazE fold protein/4-amino-4-deoxy-L-arabinose transferase-like glycosyltransferase